MKKKLTKTNNTIKLWSKRVITLVIAISLGLVGMSILQVIELPDMLIRFVGYLLIISGVVYILRNYK